MSSIPVTTSTAVNVCSPAGSTGLTTLIAVSTNGATVDPTSLGTSTVDATGCDIGIYVAPGTSGVTISGLTITGANDHGIFVQDASSITITANTVTGNGVNPTSGINENKAVELSGTSSSTVSDNTVQYNLADGGIGISDDGPIDPGAPVAGNPNPGNDNVVSGNTVTNNVAGCGIVVASYNAGEGVSGNTVEDNTVTSTGPPPPPNVGGVVLADDTPGTSGIHEVSSNNQILGNTITGGLIPGIVVHANAPYDDVVNTLISGNKFSNNGFEGGPNDAAAPVAINVVAEVPGLATITGTTISSNTVMNDYYGVWYCNTTPTVSGTQGNPTVFLASCSQPTGVPQFPFGSVGLGAVIALGAVLLLVMRMKFMRTPAVSVSPAF